MKRIFSVLLIMVLLLSSIPVSASVNYRDVPSSHWAKPDIDWATAEGLMNGTGVDRFDPEGSAERAMLVTVLYRSAGSPAVHATTPFTDLKEAWYQDAVAWAYTNGIVNGTAPTKFSPAEKITREQLATILYRYTVNTLKYTVTLSGSLNGFPDANKVSDYAKDALLWATGVGLINGDSKGGVPHLVPQGNATRAQMAAIFHRFDTYQKANRPVSVPNFNGLTKEQATAAAEAAGLAVVFNDNPPEQYDPGYRENTVVAQSPAAGASVKRGTSVTLQINIAPTVFEIPDLSGMTRHEAIQAASTLGFAVTFTDGVFTEEKPQDTVLSQKPAAATLHPKGTVITAALNTEPPVVPFRVASYNVKHFMHGSGINYEVFAEEIKEIDPDIIGLQEIDNGQGRSGKDDQMAEIAAAAGYPYYYFAKCVDMNDGEYGHGILSKYPIQKSENFMYKAQTGEKRSVERHEIYLDLTEDGVENGKTVVFYNTHLCYCGEDGNNQNIVDNQPNQMAEAFELMDLDLYPVLVGDMNIEPMDFEHVIDTTRYTPLNGGKSLTDTVNTYPQGTSSYIPIDNIILSDNLGYMPTASKPNGLVMNPTTISDHNMVYADIFFKRQITVHPIGHVPDLTGMTAEEARVALENKGYQIALKGDVNSPDATVISQSTAAGEVLGLGSTVTVTLTVIPTVPNVLGLSSSDAAALLNAAGFGVVFSKASDTASADAVTVLQYPAEGTKLAPGKTVTLTARTEKADSLTVASYDVKRFMLEASTGKVDYEAFAKEIAALGPDILGLQAVDMNTDDNGDQTKLIADMLGYKYHHYTVAATDYKGGDFGNCILSRFPIVYADGGKFAAQNGENRGYVRAIIDVNGTLITVYNTMFHNSNETIRNAQLAELVPMMERDTYPILMGNINMPPEKLEGQIDLDAFTPLNGGKELTQKQITCYGSALTYVSNIIVSDRFEPFTDNTHPTGLHVSTVSNCYHRMIWAKLRIKDASPRTLRVASYNVKHFIHGSGINYEVFAEEINEINPDIIGLQEIDKGQSRSGKDDQMKKLAEAAGYPYYYFAKCVDMNDGEYGHGILSKYPLVKTENIHYQAQSGERRSLERHEIYVDLTADGVRNGKTIVFYNTHLTLQDNVPQLGEALSIMNYDTYPILVGDMNMSPNKGAEVIDVSRYTPLNGTKTLEVTTNTFPQGASTKPIDNIILSDNIGYCSTNTTPDGLVVNRTEISDHNMIYTDIYLKDELVVQPYGPVPNVVGLTLSEARALLEEKGITVAYSESSETDGQSVVALQYPAAGARANTDNKVTLTARDPESEKLLVASYDVKQFKLEASTGAIDPIPFAEEIAALGPDVLALQAVALGDSYGDQAKTIAELLGYKYYYVSVSAEKSGYDLSNAVFSRFPMASATGELYDNQYGETRGYVRAVFNVNGDLIPVYNTMFCHNHESTRNKQLAEVLAMMAEDENAILAGNINMPPAELSDKLDLTAYTPLNGGKDLTQQQATYIGSSKTTYVSNIIISDTLEAVTDSQHPTGLHVSPVANCHHRMIWATVQLKSN
ncbi:MAG: PASTA domain-containing protein [Clostridia bacterium]|nr:PASTA domain-containing protein [Clostridia bacterium]